MVIGARMSRSGFALALGLAFTPGAEAGEGAARGRRNTVSAELGGSGLGAMVSYERALSSMVRVRVGGGVVPLVGPGGTAMSHLVFGASRHRLTAGAGVLAVWVEGRDREVVPAAEVGYRYDAPSGFVFRASVATLAGDRPPVLPGVSVGWKL